MSIITTVVLTEEDKRFIEENSISLSKLIRRTIKEKRKGQIETRQSDLSAPLNQPAKDDSI